MRFFRRRNVNSRLDQVREFVYLDEVSVESLLASVDGEILVQSTNTRSNSTEAGFSGGLSDPLTQARFTSSLKTTRGHEVQELRKSVAQSAFARFRARNLERFAIRPLDSVRQKRNDRTRLRSLDATTLRRLRQGIPLADLRRGDLLEIETNFSAADIYKARTAMNAVTDVIEAYPSFLSIEQRDAFKAARPLTELIDRLNGNAIPVVGDNPDLRIGVVNGERWLLQGTLEPTRPTPEGQVLLESVVQPQWFWGDLGRTLFQNHRFRILCRVVSPTLSESAPSSYVGTILRTIDDGLAETVDGIGPMFLGALRSGHRQAVENKKLGVSRELVDWYVGELRLAVESPEADDLEAAIAGLVEVDVAKLTSEQQKQFFNAIDTIVSAPSGAVSDDDMASLRDRARTKFGLWPWSPRPTPLEADDATSQAFEHLEVEIVAAYW